ncbi:unnamed protein product [Didymodactylos carnosus]|uniref:Uncharacterized protein n=1 Tax=Didymodactylos carnosus TaxID=1234261 RepID=A0A813SQQ2_9BILA|nr:unnamed protein product [Didymodactylos carnosus]CAF3589385.1 unnamed protein product [Didymodactylos carnosus]
MDWFDQNPLPPINLITTAPLSDVVRELPILSLQNPGTESLLESMFADHTSMLLNCRDINLAQQLCQTLSQVNTQSLTFRHSSDSITTLPPLLQTCLQINPNTFNGSTSLQIPSGIAPPLQFSSQFQPTNQSFSYSPTGFAAPHQQISPTACAYTTSSSYPHSFLPLQDNPLTNNHNFLPSYAQVPTSQSVSSSLSNNIRPTIRPTAVVPPIQKEQQHIPKEKTISPNAPSSSSLSSTSISPNKQELIFTEKFRSSPPPPLFSHDQHQHQQQV